MSAIMMKKANLLHDTKATLGEGPVWDPRTQQLYWVDIEGYGLYRFDRSSKTVDQWDFDEMIGAVAPSGEGSLLLAVEKGLAVFHPKTARLHSLGVLKNTDNRIRFNDGKVGPDKAFWVGTMDKECAPRAGNLFRVDTRLRTSLKLANTSISNGLAWTSDQKTFYYIDSDTYAIRAFDFDIGNGGISKETTVIDVPESYGTPDGMCIDSEDMLWVAHWGGHCVRQWNPKTGKVVATIAVEAPHVTSCCFGGPHLNTLFITTARSGLTSEQLEAYPLSGALFSIDLDTTGTPIHYFEIAS